MKRSISKQYYVSNTKKHGLGRFIIWSQINPDKKEKDGKSAVIINRYGAIKLRDALNEFIGDQTPDP